MSILIKRGIDAQDDAVAAELGFRRTDSPDLRGRGFYPRRAASVRPGTDRSYRIAVKQARVNGTRAVAQPTLSVDQA